MSPLLEAYGELEHRAHYSLSMSELDDAFHRFVKALGFENWSAVYLSPTRTENDEIFYIGRPSFAWGERYVEAGHADVDAAIRHLRKSNDPIWWNTFSKQSGLTRRELALFGEARELGILEGLSTAVRLAEDHLWICALTGSENEPRWDAERAFQSASMSYLRKAHALNCLDRVTGAKGKLTACERRILELYADELKLSHVARRLDRADSTVYNQMARARARLGVKTTRGLLKFLDDKD